MSQSKGRKDGRKDRSIDWQWRQEFAGGQSLKSLGSPQDADVREAVRDLKVDVSIVFRGDKSRSRSTLQSSSRIARLEQTLCLLFLLADIPTHMSYMHARTCGRMAESSYPHFGSKRNDEGRKIWCQLANFFGVRPSFFSLSYLPAFVWQFVKGKKKILQNLGSRSIMIYEQCRGQFVQLKREDPSKKDAKMR